MTKEIQLTTQYNLPAFIEEYIGYDESGDPIYAPASELYPELQLDSYDPYDDPYQEHPGLASNRGPCW